MLVRALRLAENLAILSLLTGSAVAMRMTVARARRRHPSPALTGE
jgi:hypothetical protein